MLPVSTLPAILHAHVTQDMKGMESGAQVCSLLEICMSINNKMNRNNV